METAAQNIWLSQDGQKWGPYTEQMVRQWLAEGKFLPNMLAWREGASDWVPLASLLGIGVSSDPPAIASVQRDFQTSTESLSPQGTRSDPFGWSGPQQGPTDKLLVLPRPPSLHWSLVLLFTVLTLGIFGFIWTFIQASWVRRIDKRSNATWLLVGWVLSTIVASVLAMIPMMRGMPSVGISILSLLVNVAGLVFLVVAYFSMANSVRRELPKYGVPVSIGGVTLFFFTYLYFQGQLRWFSRWREGDRNDGKPPKGIFWLLMSIVFIGAIMLAIAFPTYLDYVKRSQTLAAQSSQLSGENAANTIPNVATDYSNPPSTNTEGQAVSSMPSVQDEAEAIARAATEADTGATLAADTTEMGTDPTLEEAVPDPYAAYRAEQEAKRNAELLATKARVDWINTCATRSRTLATPAGSEIGLNAQEATHYCECVHDAQSGSEAGLAQGKCLDRLMQSAD